jgi:hypothetical protein
MEEKFSVSRKICEKVLIFLRLPFLRTADFANRRSGSKPATSRPYPAAMPPAGFPAAQRQ